MSTKTLTFALLCGSLLAASPASAQWEKRIDDSLPKAPDGVPDLSAAAPKAPDGKPDLSGVWLGDVDPELDIVTVEHAAFPRHFIDITGGLDPDDVPFQPSAKALFEKRLAGGPDVENPTAFCKPTGFPWLNTVPLPFKVVQTGDLVLILYEENNVFRQIFMDGRRKAEDALPRWMGYSTGRWEGDELVVETTGFNDEHWLDGMGHPHSDRLTVTERFHRTDAGHLAIEITIDDPGAYTRPITYTPTYTLQAEDDLLEYFCTENERSSTHYR